MSLAEQHPPAPVATPSAHPAVPLALVSPGSPNVLINKLQAARVGDETVPCALPTCAPGGPGVVAKGSGTVKINNLPAARAGDPTAHSGCLAPIGAPSGQILSPCSPTVIIGG